MARDELISEYTLTSSSNSLELMELCLKSYYNPTGSLLVHANALLVSRVFHVYFRRSKTHTEPSDALAPTLSPRAFQHTSKMPPVPR